MTAAIDKKMLATKLRRRPYTQTDPDPIQDAAIISDKVQRSSCFGTAVSVVAVAVVAALSIFGAQSEPDEPLCICIEYIGDNGDCPVHGKGHKQDRAGVL